MNLHEGRGLVFNEGERVEGYSNFLYVVIMSVVFNFVDKNGVYLCSVSLNMIFILVAVLLFFKYVQRQLGDKYATGAGLLFALCPAVWLSVASGMETSLVVLIQILVWVAVERCAEDPNNQRILALCGASALSLFVRADGFILPMIAVLYLVLRGRKRAAIVCGVSVIIALGLYLVWRHDYYGYLLPNTYYAKVSGPITDRLQHGVRRLGGIALNEGLLPYLIAFGFATFALFQAILRRWWHAVREPSFATVFGLCWLAYWVYIGGDCFRERFLIIIFPMGIYLFLAHVGRALPRKALLFCLILLAMLQLTPLATDSRFGYTLTRYDRWVTLGRFLSQHHPSSRLAIDAAGKVPFFSGLHTLDMLGLNDPVLAHKSVQTFNVPGHNKFDADYVLSMNPDLIAAWVKRDTDLQCGLTAEKYEAHGYSLRYLVNSRMTPADTNIIDVHGVNENRISGFIRRGYDYAVIEKLE
ncbi:MAG: DUF2029 domain-containing protein [candidate division Zixibacteria bacterium]|nr:DUF2029 domain-containing protein [candidate division Zixibacteria bacterium]